MITIDPAKYTILIVDDNATNVMLISSILKKIGYKLLTAFSGEEALASVNKERPDLILLDIMMPNMDGFEVAQRLKKSDETKDIAIIFVTAMTESINEVRGFVEGASDYICKPIKADVLRTRIVYLLQQIEYKRTIEMQRYSLQKAIENRDKIHSIIAHDLRSPLATLTMIHNMLLLNLEKEVIGEDMYEMLEDANRVTDSTFILLDNLLKWSKLQMNSLKLTFANIDIRNMITSVVESSGYIAAYKKIEITADMPDEMMVSVDIDTMKTVFRNLLSNAIKFSTDGGHIYVTSDSDDENIYLHFKDEGVGIKDENKNKLLGDDNFTTFGTKNEEGSGLGLSICKDFIGKNGGKIWFESTYGVGTTFSVSLPRVIEEES